MMLSFNEWSGKDADTPMNESEVEYRLSSLDEKIVSDEFRGKVINLLTGGKRLEAAIKAYLYFKDRGSVNPLKMAAETTGLSQRYIQAEITAGALKKYGM